MGALPSAAGTRGLPLPLAQLRRRAENARSALERHQAAYYLWEAALKLLGAVLVARYAAGVKREPALTERLRALARPSIGQWWEAVRKLSPAVAGDAPRDLLLGRARDDLPRAAGLDALLRETLDGERGARSTVRVQDLFDRLVRYRNRELGHGAAGQRPREFYEHLGTALLAGVGEILDRLDVLLGSRLLAVAEVRRLASGRWLIERLELCGESARRIEPLELPDSAKESLPRPASVGVETAGQWLSLHPLVSFDVDAEEFFFLNARRGRERSEYLSYTSGRTLELPEFDGDRRELLQRLLGERVDAQAEHAWAQKSLDEEPAPSSDTTSPVRRTIGEFELVSRIGRGGMGVVYRAWQPSLSRQVALKCLLAAADPRVEARFAREIKALGRVDHPNLVKVFASGSDGEQWYYAMELVDGADLASVLDRLSQSSSSELGESEWKRAVSTACIKAREKEEPVSSAGAPPRAEVLRDQQHDRLKQEVTFAKDHLRQAVAVVRQVAGAAHALHEAGVVHRDVKPGNVMLTQDGAHAVLMDLGVAQLADEAEGRLTRTRQFVGTVRYASPEQILAAATLDRRADVYSLGATLYELLTLKPLLGAGDETPTADLMLRIQTTEPERPRRLNPRIPRDLESIVLKCLEKDRSRRYGTARELAEDLERWERGEPVEAEPATFRYLLAKAVRRHRGRIAAAASLLLVALAAALYGVWRIEEARRAAEIALFDSYTDAGLRAADEGNPAQALLWFSAASEFARHDSRRAEANEVRMRTWRREVPGIVAAIEHPGLNVTDIVFHPDSAHLMTLAEEGRCTIWDLAEEKPLAFPPPERVVKHAVFSPDGKRLALAGASGPAEIFAFPSGAKLHAIDTEESVLSMAYSADGHWLALGGKRVRLWDAKADKFVETALEPASPSVFLLFAHKGDRLIATGQDHAASVFDLAHSPVSTKPVFSTPPMAGSDLEVVLALALVDGERALASVSSRYQISLWSLSDGSPRGRIQADGQISGMTPDAEAQRLAIREESEVDVWDSATQRPLWRGLSHGREVADAQFSPDGAWLATGSEDRKLRLWRLPFRISSDRRSRYGVRANLVVPLLRVLR